MANIAQEPVEVAGVYVGYRYASVLAEMAFGESTPEFALREFEGESPPPRVLGVGELVAWSANLDKLEDGSNRES